MAWRRASPGGLRPAGWLAWSRATRMVTARMVIVNSMMAARECLAVRRHVGCHARLSDWLRWLLVPPEPGHQPTP